MYSYYATVFGINAAGLRAVAFSAPFTADTSPPVLAAGVTNRPVAGGTFLPVLPPGSDVDCSWRVVDPESGVHHVAVGLGFNTSMAGAVPYTPVSDPATDVTESFDVSGLGVDASTELYVRVVAKGGACRVPCSACIAAAAGGATGFAASAAGVVTLKRGV